MHLLTTYATLQRTNPSPAAADTAAACLAAAQRAADDIWARGLLTKGVGLCHGISGNAYAFLALHRATGEDAYLARAQQFALYAARHWQALYGRPDRPASLYEGLAGSACLWMDVLRPDAPCAGMPGCVLML